MLKFYNAISFSRRFPDESNNNQYAAQGSTRYRFKMRLAGCNSYESCLVQKVPWVYFRWQQHLQDHSSVCRLCNSMDPFPPSTRCEPPRISSFLAVVGYHRVDFLVNLFLPSIWFPFREIRSTLCHTRSSTRLSSLRGHRLQPIWTSQYCGRRGPAMR
jgi:hypothetical protein